MSKIRIKVEDLEVLAEIYDDTKTGKAVLNALPLVKNGNTWGDEIYFSIPVDVEPENPKAVVNIGEIGYWPPGTAFCIFFGPTPMSRGKEIRPASPVNVFGKIIGDPKVFQRVHDGAKVQLEAVEE